MLQWVYTESKFSYEKVHCACNFLNLKHVFCNVSKKLILYFLSLCRVIMIQYDVVMILGHYDHYDIGTIKRLLLSVKSDASIAC